MSNPKADNIQFFRSKLSELLADPLLRGKFVVVHGGEIRQSFDTFDAALRFAVARYPANEFIVQQVIADSEVVSFVRAAL